MAVDSTLIGTTATAPLAPRLTWPEQVTGFIRAKPLGAAGAVIMLAMLLVALLAHALAPYDPYLADYGAQFARPGADHWFGTDEFGRDVLSRIMYGARIALFVGFAASFAGCSLGATLGVVSAYCGGTVDLLLERVMDVLLAIPHQRFDLLDADEFQRTYAVNLIGNYQMCRAAAPHLKATGDAAIVNISSIGAMRGAGSSIAYAASKGALNTLTISMARALAPEVRVNALCPGGLLGSWTRKIMTEEQYQARVRQAQTEFPLRRGIWPIDVARAALFLVEHAVAMTGECLRMDSGEHLGANLIRN